MPSLPQHKYYPTITGPNELDAGLITPLPASDSGSAAVWGSKRINPRPQSCLCLTWSGCSSNDDDDDGVPIKIYGNFSCNSSNIIYAISCNLCPKAMLEKQATLSDNG